MIRNIDRFVTAFFAIFIFYISYLSYNNNAYIWASLLVILASYLLIASIIPHRFVTEEITGNLFIELIRLIFEVFFKIIINIFSH